MAIPSEYAYLLETVDFLWRNTQIYAITSGKSMRYYSSSYNICYQPANECSFLSYNEQSSSFQEAKMIATTVGSIHITDNGGTITVSYDNFKLNFWSEYNQKWIEWIEPDGTYGDYLEVPHTGSWKTSQTVDFRNFQTSFNSLSDACNYIYCNFKHCYIYYNNELWVNPNPPEPITSNGGGATHIAKVTGQLKDLSSNLSDILMVSGGGGGGCLVNENAYNGADAGGISGSGNNSGNQSSGYAFGQGESGNNESGGGSGLYGGTKNGTSSTVIMNSWCKTTDYNNHRQSSHRHNFTVNFNTDVVSELSSYLGSDYILEYLGDNPSGGMYSQVPIAYDGDNNVFYSSVYNKHIALPIKSGIGKIVKLAFSYTNKSSGSYAWIQVGLLKINGNTTTTLKYAQYSSTGNYELTLDTPTEADYLWICNAEDLFEISNMTMYVQASIMNEAGAGSGYIGNSLLSNKKMIGYNVPTSDAEGTKTESVNVFDSNYVANKPKAGNGHVRIKYLSDGIIRFKNAIVFPHNDFAVIGKNQVEYTIAQVSQMCAGKNNNTYYLQWSGTRYICLMFNEASGWDMKLASDAYAKGEGQEDWLYGMNGVSPLYPCELDGNYLGGSWSFNSVFVDNTYYIDYGDRGGTEEHPIIIVSNLANFDVYKDGVKVMVR